MTQILDKIELIQKALNELTACESCTNLALETPTPSKSVSTSLSDTSNILQVDGLERCSSDPVP